MPIGRGLLYEMGKMFSNFFEYLTTFRIWIILLIFERFLLKFVNRSVLSKFYAGIVHELHELTSRPRADSSNIRWFTNFTKPAFYQGPILPKSIVLPVKK